MELAMIMTILSNILGIIDDGDFFLNGIGDYFGNFGLLWYYKDFGVYSCFYLFYDEIHDYLATISSRLTYGIVALLAIFTSGKLGRIDICSSPC